MQTWNEFFLTCKVGGVVEPQRAAANISADLVKPWLRSASYLSSNAARGECGHLIPQPVRFIPSLSVSLPLSRLHNRVRTFTRTHNGRSKFFQGISRLINRLVVWGSSEVQRSRLNPLTGGIISGRWVHTSPVCPSHTHPLLTWLVAK